MCRLSRLMNAPLAVMPTDVTPSGDEEYSLVTPACLIVAGDEVLVGVDAVWSTHVSAN